MVGIEIEIRFSISRECRVFVHRDRLCDVVYYHGSLTSEEWNVSYTETRMFRSASDVCVNGGDARCGFAAVSYDVHRRGLTGRRAGGTGSG